MYMFLCMYIHVCVKGINASLCPCVFSCVGMQGYMYVCVCLCFQIVCIHELKLEKLIFIAVTNRNDQL